MPLIDAITRGLGVAAQTANVGFDEFQNQKRLQQEQEANAKRIEQADLAIEEAQQRKENERKQTSANNAARQMMMHGNSQALQDHLNNYSPEGFKYDIQRKPDGTYTVNETSSNGTVTGTDYDEDEMGTFLYMSTVEQPQAVLADDVKRKRAASALQAQQQREDQIREDKQAHDLNKIVIENQAKGKLERYKSLLKLKEEQLSGKVPDWQKELIKLNKNLTDEMNFARNDPDIKAYALDYAFEAYKSLPDDQKSVARADRMAKDHLRFQQGTDPNFLTNIKKATRAAANGDERGALEIWGASRSDFPLDLPGFGATQESESSPQSGATPSQDQPEGQGATPKPGATAKPKGKDVVEKDGRIFVKMPQKMGGRAPKLVELHLYDDGRWYGEDPKTGTLHPYIKE